MLNVADFPCALVVMGSLFLVLSNHLRNKAASQIAFVHSTLTTARLARLVLTLVLALDLFGILLLILFLNEVVRVVVRLVGRSRLRPRSDLGCNRILAV